MVFFVFPASSTVPLKREHTCVNGHLSLPASAHLSLRDYPPRLASLPIPVNRAVSFLSFRYSSFKSVLPTSSPTCLALPTFYHPFSLFLFLFLLLFICSSLSSFLFPHPYPSPFSFFFFVLLVTESAAHSFIYSSIRVASAVVIG